MAFCPGTRLGHYEVTASLGEGGMGAVWRARDTKLDRDVALKILPEAFVHDADRVARFTREAKTLAALNHPHIAGIYGLEESGGVTALVMELVEGEDLSQRIARGPIPVDQALAIARQIAEALEAAHEQGIVHRDLKPANVKVRADGTVKVLDFGLAKAMDPPGVAANATVSPTITSPAMTAAGIILGTAAYMSPEQAAGKPVDKRSDLWALGVVLLEMLTGRRVFDGETVSHVLAAVLKEEPEWSRLPADTPAPIRTLLRRCLAKDRKRRLADASDARLEIEDALTPGASPSLDEAALQARLDTAAAIAHAQFGRVMRTRMVLVAIAALLAVGATAGGMWLATRPAPPRVVQTAITTTAAMPLAYSPGDRSIAITPDGARIVYNLGGESLVVRALDALEPVSLDTRSGRNPFVSPDGQWVGFVEANSVLKKVAITGGPAVTVAQEDGFSRGAVWLPDDTLVFATAAPATGLQQVAADGGAVTVLTRPDREQGEEDHVWPEALPGGGAVLFTITSSTGDTGAAEIAVLDLATGTHAVVLRGGSHAQYVARRSTGTGPAGYLVYAAGGNLRAVAFDPKTRTTRGTPVPVMSEVVTTVNPPAAGGVQAAVAADGTLAYVRVGTGGTARRTLAWVDRQGRETAFAAPPAEYVQPRVSPDGSRLAVAVFGEDLWVGDVAHDTLTRLTFMPGREYFPVWGPDSRRLFFSSDQDGVRNLYAQAADGTGTAERLTTSPNEQYASGATPDGTRLLFTERSPQTGFDIMQIELAGSRAVTPLVQTPADEDNGVVSPDGRWLAYQANDSGAFQIYVRPYPDVTSGRWQVSTGGGTQPLWSPDGRELFYVSPSGALMRVGVERGTSWGATPPTAVWKDGAVLALSDYGGVQYDVSPDGQRFLVLRRAPASDSEPPQLIVIQHFDALLQRLVPGQD